MKLTICQCCKLFLLLTAFSFFDSLKSVGLFAKQVVVATTNASFVSATLDPTIATSITDTAAATIAATESPPFPHPQNFKTTKAILIKSMLFNALKNNTIKDVPATVVTHQTSEITPTTTYETTSKPGVTKSTFSFMTFPQYGSLHANTSDTTVSNATVSMSMSTPTLATISTSTLSSTSSSAASPSTPKSTIKTKSKIEKPFEQLQKRNARKTNARTTQRQQQRQQQQQQRQKQLTKQQQHQQLQQEQQLLQQQQQKQQRVVVLLSSKILNTMRVQQGFYDFVDFFQVNLKGVSIDFLRNDDLSDFIKLLQHSNYTTVVKTLNVGISVDDDLVAATEAKPTTASPAAVTATATTTTTTTTTPTETAETNHIERAKHSSGYHETLDKSYNFSENVNADKTNDDNVGEIRDDDAGAGDNVNDVAFDEDGINIDKVTTCSATDIGYCHLAEELSRGYNKSVILWPCSKMRGSSNFLPSYETISYAVQSIATKLNWTQVEIFVGDQNWGLPLAIAANLQIPYKIEIGNNVRDLLAKDTIGKAIIVTADMNDDSTLRLLRQLATLQHTKILLIDMLATSFNAENRFYKNLERIKTTSQLMSNLLLLTVLSDKYRHFLNVAFDDNGIEMVQNFRQIRRWRAMSTKKRGSVDSTNWWPIHLDSSVTQVFHHMGEHNGNEHAVDDVAAALNGLDLNECAFWPNATEWNFVEICQNIENIVENCTIAVMKSSDRKMSSNEIRLWLQHLCQLEPSQVEGYSSRAQETIANLRNFIDLFNFYDFLVASILQSNSSSMRGSAKDDPQSLPSHEATVRREHVAKYDFIVLDVVRGDSSTSAFVSVATNGGTTTTTTTTTPTPTPTPVATGNSTTSYMLNANKNYMLYNSSSNNNGNSNKKANNNNSETFKWRPLLILEQHEINLNTYITHSILPGYDDWLLASSSHLFQCGAICWTIVAICIGFLFIIVAGSVAAGIAMRNYLLRKRLSKGPHKIVLSPNDFVFPVDSRRVDEGIEAMLCCWLQQLQEFGGPEVDKPDLLKGSIGSLKNLGLLIPGQGTTLVTSANGKAISNAVNLARHNPALLDMRARYNGDLVQLKEISLNGSVELKSKAMDLLVMAHGLRHENINPLIGWLSDPNRTAMVFDYCSRGSLQDVLIMDEIKLDWSFRLSLLTDLVRGMRYLHASSLRVHGALSSRNCVVDARWVLKITDYGLASFYEAQGLNQMPRSAKELLWTAPELLRSMKTAHHQQHLGGRVVGTQMGDVYSFGIIMQEVVVRGEPFCMLSLSAEEIIAKIKKPPPLIRPSVSKGAAPPEAINIMRQCWAEQPDMRPDFNSVYERFKMLNHGRKVNFVDTMFQMLEKYSNNLEELIRERTEQLDIERKKTEQLLNRMLPSSVAEKLKMGLAVDPEEFSDVTIYFSDIVGFTTIAAHCSPVQVVDLLNDLYTIFDATINAYNVYKVETIGDAYMVVSGLPVKIPDHAEQIATMALDLLHQSGSFNVKHLPGVPLQLRIGLHTGPCCAGVVGLTMPRYCLFGDTVNTASRMESSGSSWRIHMSQETRDRLEARGGYMIEPRGLIEIKGKGTMNTFWLLGKKGFEKPLPIPPPIGLDESLIRNSITKANKSRNSTNPSSSQSSSLAGESVEVKVEITPPTNVEICSSNLPNSYSLDSNSTNTISPNTTLCPDFPSKTPSTSPQSRKMSELTTDTLLNPNTFNRLPNSTSGSSSRLYKKIEEMMDLSSPYNHYKCLSPSESNLNQFHDGKYHEGKYLYSASGVGNIGAHSGSMSSSGGGSAHGGSAKFDSKPGSSRLLRRQFSLDRDDPHSKHDTQHLQYLQQTSLQATHMMTSCTKSGMLDIPVLHDTTRSPKLTMSRVVHKQNSNSIAQDLEKIEEIPLSPASSQHHSSLDSSLNRSPPSTLEAQSQSFVPNTPPSPTVPAIPTVMRSLSDSYCDVGSVSPSPPALHHALESMECVGTLESSTTDASTTTTATAPVNSTNNTTPAEEGGDNIRKTELTLNVEALLTR